jgi:hypothetical protein
MHGVYEECSSLREAIQEAFAIAPVNKVILHTLEITQNGVQDPVYIVQSRRPIVAKDESGNSRLFQPVGFNFNLPAATEEGFRSIDIAIDNVGRAVSDFIHKAIEDSTTPVRLIYRPYLSDNLEEPQMNPPLELWLKEIQVTAQQVLGRASFMDLVNRKFPSELFTRERFPTLG